MYKKEIRTVAKSTLNMNSLRLLDTKKCQVCLKFQPISLETVKVETRMIFKHLIDTDTEISLICYDCKTELHRFDDFRQRIQKGYEKAKSKNFGLSSEGSQDVKVEEDPGFTYSEETVDDLEEYEEYVTVEAMPAMELDGEQSTFETKIEVIEEYDQSSEPAIVKSECHISDPNEVFHGEAETHSSEEADFKPAYQGESLALNSESQKDKSSLSLGVERLDKPKLKGKKKKKVKVFIYECEYCPLTTR